MINLVGTPHGSATLRRNGLALPSSTTIDVGNNPNIQEMYDVSNPTATELYMAFSAVIHNSGTAATDKSVGLQITLTITTEFSLFGVHQTASFSQLVLLADGTFDGTPQQAIFTTPTVVMQDNTTGATITTIQPGQDAWVFCSFGISLADAWVAQALPNFKSWAVEMIARKYQSTDNIPWAVGSKTGDRIQVNNWFVLVAPAPTAELGAGAPTYYVQTDTA